MVENKNNQIVLKIWDVMEKTCKRICYVRDILGEFSQKEVLEYIESIDFDKSSILVSSPSHTQENDIKFWQNYCDSIIKVDKGGYFKYYFYFYLKN